MMFTSQLQRIHTRAFPESPAVVPFDAGYSNPLWGDPKVKSAAVAVEPGTTPEIPAGDLPPVIAAPEPEISPEVRARKLLSAATAAIAGLDLNGDPALESRAADLRAELFSLSGKLGVFLADVRKANIRTLTSQQEKAAAQCREQQAVIDGAESRYEEASAAVRKLAGVTASCRALFKACDAARPELDLWPNRVEVARWKVERARLSQALEQATDAEFGGRNELARVGQALVREQGKLAALADAELALRNRLSGEEFFDSETGLEHPPEL